MALPLNGLRPGDSDDDGSVAGESENERPQRGDIMVLIRQCLFAKARSPLAQEGYDTEGLWDDTDCK